MIRASAVILDLDGTLLDTVEDLAAAANLMRAEFGLSPLPLQQVATYVGKGAEILVHRVLSEEMDGRIDAQSYVRAHAAFLRHYAVENGRSATAFPGVREGLDAMRDKGLRLACVTNKPAAFTEPLLARSRLAPYFELVVCGDTLTRKKPDPMPLLHVAQCFGVAPSQVVAIGDSVNDAVAARAAGMAVLAVPYGYNEGRDVRSLDTDGIVATLQEAALRIEPIPR
jgi:phosphoglycolate phosphatase